MKKTILTKFRPFIYIFSFIIIYVGVALIIRAHYIGIYRSAVDEINAGQYQSGIDKLRELGDYQDSLLYIEKAEHRLEYDNAVSLFDQGNYEAAKREFVKIEDTEILNVQDGKDPTWYINEIERIAFLQEVEKEQAEKEKRYKTAYDYFKHGEYQEAILLLQELSGYKDSDSILKQCFDRIERLKYSTTISAGISSSAGVRADGKAYLTGEQVLVPSDVEDWKDVISVSTMGSLVIGLKIDGTVITAGELDNDYHIETGNWDDIIAVSAGDLYIVGLRSNGTLVAQGYNNYGQMNIGGWNNIIAVSTGWRLTAGLDIYGNIHVAGRNADAIISEINRNIDDWSGIVAISAGGGSTAEFGERGHIVALKDDHTAVAAGDNSKGQCNVTGPEWTNLIAVSAGAYHTVGLRADGTVVTTQTDKTVVDEIEEWNLDKDIVEISAGYGFTIGLKSNGRVVGSGFFLNEIRNTDNWEDIAQNVDEWRSIFDR